MLIFKPGEKKQSPFYLLFKHLSPKEFVFSFRNEYKQTIAFLLSYAPGTYRRKVIKLIKDENARKLLIELLHDMKCRQKTPSAEFIAEMEKASLEYIHND